MAQKGKQRSNRQTVTVYAPKGEMPIQSVTFNKDSFVIKCAFFLGLLAFCLYANTLQNGFALDDSSSIKQNALVRQGIRAIPEIFSTPYHYGNFRARSDGPAIDDLYRPISLAFFAAEFWLFGENPLPGHLTNILLFAGCVILLFFFLYHLFKKKRLFISFTGAFLFAIHPIHTEVVANIKSLDELLCFFFGLLMLIGFIKYMDSGKKKILAASLACFFISLLSKETAITLLVLIPLIFYFFRNENRQRSLVISLLSLITAVLYLAIRFSVLISHKAYNPGNVPFLENALAGAPTVAVRFATEILILGAYLKLLFLPYPLVCDYTFNAIPFVDFTSLLVWLSLAIYILLAFLGISRLIKKQGDPLAFGILFFLITISIFSNIALLLGSEMAERFLFYPSAGFCLMIAFILEQALYKKDTENQGDIYNKKTLYVLIPLAIVFGGMTIDRNRDWKDSYTLFKTDSKKSPENARLSYFEANEEISVLNDPAANPDQRGQMLQLGIANLQKSLAIYPDYHEAHISLSDAFLMAGQSDSAIVHGEKGLALGPNDPAALNALANAYMAIKKYPEAIELCRKASQINPGNPNYTGNIGVCNIFLNHYDSAIYYFRKSIETDPLNVKSIQFLSVAFNAAGQRDSAKKYEARARITEPGFNVDKVPLPK